MASPPILFVFTLILFFTLSISVKAEKNTTAIDFAHDICNKTDDLKKLCYKLIDSDPRQDLKSNFTGLLTIVVYHSITNFNASVLFLQEQIKSGKLDRDTMDMFEACEGDFQLGIEDLQSTLHMLLTEKSIIIDDLPVLNMYGYITGCEQDFDGYPVPPEWHRRYWMSRAFLDLAFAMTNFMQCNRAIACIPPLSD